MINPYRVISGNLPERLPSGRDALPADVKSLRAWAESLPRANQQVYLQELLRVLTAFHSRRFEGFARLDALEVLRPMLMEAVGLLVNRLHGSVFPLTGARVEAAQHLSTLHRELALGYRMAVAEACAPAGKVPFLRGGNVALALVRAVYHHVRWLSNAYFLYRAPEPGAWSQLYALTLFAAAHKLDTKPVEDPVERRPLSAALLQNQAVLLSLANPYRFSQRELVDMWNLTRDVAGLVDLTPQRFAAAGALVLVERDVPPAIVARAPEPDEGDVLWVDLRKLNDLIRAAVSHAGGAREALLRLSRDYRLTLPVELLARALEGWAQDGSRSFPRVPGGYVLDSVVGLSALHYQLAGQCDFDTFLRDVRGVSTLQADRAGWASGANEAIRADAVEARVQDQSLGGYRLRWSGEYGVRVRIGEVIGVALPLEPALRDWAVGTVRWLRYEADGAIEAGVDLVARRTHAVALRGLDEAGGSQTSMRALELEAIAGNVESTDARTFLVDGMTGLDAPQVEVLRFAGRWDPEQASNVQATSCPTLRPRRRTGDYLVVAPGTTG